jgi:hypothetical protein
MLPDSAHLQVAAELDGVRTLHPAEIVVERIDRVLTAVVGWAAPSRDVAKAQVQEVLAAVRNIAQADFVLPVDAAPDGGLIGSWFWHQLLPPA